MEEKILHDRKLVVRHSSVELIEHWVLAVSGLLLLFSGFGELPMYKRYMVTEIPGFSWAGDFYVNLKIHYLAAIVFIGVIVFHFVYHGWLGHRGLLPKKGDVGNSIKTILSFVGIGEEPKADKYLPEQRLAYFYLGIVGAILAVTGAIKVLKNLPTVYFSPGVVTAATLIHTFATILFLLGVLAHLAALILKVNRPMVKPIFTGKMNLAYVQRRHSLWYERLAPKSLKVEAKEPATLVAVPEVQASQNQEENPSEPEKPLSKPEDAMGESGGTKEDSIMTTFKVKGMTCQHCVMAVQKALGYLDGVKNIEVDLNKGEVHFENPKGISADKIREAIEAAGYQVESASQ
jgi:formate dehydrogenase gamma subunit